jgi:Fur family ferric uptake transcriptional regulator
MSEDFSLGTVEVALTPRQRFEEYLQSRGKRLTEQRRTLVDHIFTRHEHFDADELIESLVKVGMQRRVSRPTVYRTLRELVEAGLLRKIMELDGRAVYDHDYGYPAHDHLHCEKCGKLIEFHSDELVRIRDAVAAEHGFRVASHRLIVEGTCKECQMATRRERRRLDRI